MLLDDPKQQAQEWAGDTGRWNAEELALAVEPLFVRIAELERERKPEGWNFSRDQALEWLEAAGVWRQRAEQLTAQVIALGGTPCA